MKKHDPIEAKMADLLDKLKLLQDENERLRKRIGQIQVQIASKLDNLNTDAVGTCGCKVTTSTIQP